MNEPNPERHRAEEFLSSPPFVRMCGVWETYQQLLGEKQADPVASLKIKERMHEVLDVRSRDGSDNELTEAEKKIITELDIMRRQVFTWCEQGEFGKEKMAELYAHSSIAKLFLERWNPAPGSETLDGHTVVNAVLEFDNTGPDDSNVCLNIFPTSVKEVSKLLRDVAEGLRKVAGEMKHGSLQHVGRVTMTSWLFSSRLERKVRDIFGEDVVLTDVPDGREPDVQKMALTFNKRAMADYLVTGQKPPVRELVIPREDFLKKFG